MRLVGVKRKERSKSNEEPPEVRVSRSDPGILEGDLVRCGSSERLKNLEDIRIQME